MINNIHEPDPMAEIALALAMGFFSIMVLTMISMSAGFQAQTTINSEEKIEVQSAQKQTEHSDTEKSKTDSKPFILIFNKGQYFDVDLHRVSPGELQVENEIVLAVMPDLSITETIDAKKRVNAKNIKVTILDKRWINRLKEMD